MRAMTRVLVTEPVHPDALALLRGRGLEVIDGALLSAGERAEVLAEVEAILVRTMVLPGAVMAPPLRLVAKHGTGVDNIPLGAARAAGVTVANTPGANAGSVAEHALMLMLALAKRLGPMQARARAGLPADPAAGVCDLAGRRLLVVGYGRIGRRVAALAQAIGMEVHVFAPGRSGGRTAEGYRQWHDLGAALGIAEVLSLHCPLNEATRGLIDAAALARLPDGALLVNTARGGLVDEAALGHAAASGRLGGFALDVLECEPVPPEHPLLHSPIGIVTPHSAAISAEAFRRMGMEAARNVIDFLDGRLDPARIVVGGRTAAEV